MQKDFSDFCFFDFAKSILFIFYINALPHLHVKIKYMRLDKFLKVSRLIKRRTVANEVSDMGRIFVNDKQAKPSKQLKEGDLIKIEHPNKSICAKILKIPQGNVSVQEAPTLYEIVE